MKKVRTIALLTAIMVLAPVAPGETAPSVLKQVPAGSMGFVVINNVQATATRVDKFIKDIGVNKMLPPMPPGGVLTMIKSGANLGEGFNADGGVAVAMLDPQQFGLDLVALMKAGPDAKPPKPEDIPVVFFVAGSDVKGVFGEMAKPAGKYFQLDLKAPFPIIATAHNGYVLLSPSKAALAAVVSARKSAADELSKEHAAAIAKSDLAYYINMKITGPVINGAIKMFEEQIAGEMGGMGGGRAAMPTMMGDPTMILALYRTLIDEMDALTVGANLSSAGVTLDLMVSFSPDSALTKIAAAFPGTVKPSVGRLPNLPYVIAAAGLAEDSKEARDFAESMTDKMFGKDMPKDLRDRLAKIEKVANDDITSFQFVAGGAPQGKGLFGVAALIECKNTKNVKAMIADLVEFAGAAIKSIDPNSEELQQLKIAYSNNIATVGTITVDAITVTHPELDNMPARAREEMKKVLGEDKILIRVAAVDAKTVAVTFGGAAAFMNETIKSAKLGGRIVSRRDTRQLAKHMPEKPTGFVLISVGNLFEVIKTGMQAMNPDESIPINITTKDPIVFSGGYTGKASHMIIHVPTKLIAEAVTAFGGLWSEMGGGVAPVPPGGDF